MIGADALGEAKTRTQRIRRKLSSGLESESVGDDVMISTFRMTVSDPASSSESSSSGLASPYSLGLRRTVLLFVDVSASLHMIIVL